MAPRPQEEGTEHEAFRLALRGSAGVLLPDRAEADTAFASGYARGQEDAQADELDRWRTVLVTLLEARFGALDENVLDRVAASDLGRLERWIIALPSAATAEDVFGPTSEVE